MIPMTLAGIPGGEFGWMVLIAFVALMIFGKRLPEVGRSVGKGLLEFKKGLAGAEEEIKNAGAADAAKPQNHKIEASVTKTLTMTAPPLAQSPSAQDMQDQLRATQEQLRQLNDQLAAAKAQLEQIQKPGNRG